MLSWFSWGNVSFSELGINNKRHRSSDVIGILVTPIFSIFETVSKSKFALQNVKFWWHPSKRPPRITSRDCQSLWKNGSKCTQTKLFFRDLVQYDSVTPASLALFWIESTTFLWHKLKIIIQRNKIIWEIMSNFHNTSYLSVLATVFLVTGTAEAFAATDFSKSSVKKELLAPLQAWSLPTAFSTKGGQFSFESSWYTETNPTARKTVYDE